MKLFRHAEFEQIVIRAAERFSVSEQFVEKDYYITEILRIVAREFGERVIFKGGTSLSKGWNLISRFSEDVDVFLNPDAFTPRPGKNKIDQLLKDLRNAVGTHPALTYLEGEGKTIGGRGREDYFGYTTKFGALPGIRPAVRLEPGIQSGSFPTESRPISSLVSEYLREEGRQDMADDLDSFDMVLLHYRRTFVEKMFAIHGKVVRLIDEDHPIGRDARHFADLYVLAGLDDVRAMLNSPEYDDIRRDYDEKSRAFWAATYRPPLGLSFKASPALFPDSTLTARIARDYDAQCRLLFPGGNYPSFDDVLGRFAEIRSLV